MVHEPNAEVCPTEQEEWALQWHVMLSFAYHRKRERFLDGSDRMANALAALAGASAFAAILGKLPTEVGLWASGIVAVTSTLVLVYGPAATARRHSELARDFKKLEAEMCGVGPGRSQKQHFEFKARALALEASEPPQLGALVTECHNELSVAHDLNAKITPLPWWQRGLLLHLINFDQSEVDRPTPLSINDVPSGQASPGVLPTDDSSASVRHPA
jgi:hypothetical protein